MRYTWAQASAERRARRHYVEAFTLLVKLGAFEPISPEPGVYAWAPARVDPRVRVITAQAVADLLGERAS